MIFIIFDLEFNQDLSSLQNFEKRGTPYPFEIIQIGAIVLDSSLYTIGKFNRYVKPTFYSSLNPFVNDLTGITLEQLEQEEPFPEIYKDFIEFITKLTNPRASATHDSVFCTWGMTDITELFRNVAYHNINSEPLPRKVIDLQLYITKQFNQSPKKLLRLQHAVELLSIPISAPFHNAINDAFYTVELFKKVYTSDLQPKIYDPTQKHQRPRPRRTVVDYDRLLQQFEKMYARKITLEEQGMIKLAYKMGRTNQFTKEVPPEPNNRS